MNRFFYLYLIFIILFTCSNTLSYGQNSDIDTEEEAEVRCFGEIVKRNNLMPVVTTDFAAILDGAVTGVEVTNGSGQPGATGNIRIRGTHDFIGGGGTPMIVLDSVPFYGNLNEINLHDIASVSVLKDGSAAALYGLEALNGVVFINTKTSIDNKFYLNIDAGLGITTQAFADYKTIQNNKSFYEVSWNQLRNYYHGAGYDLQTSSQMASDNFLAMIIGLGYNAYNVPHRELIDSKTGKLNSSAELRYSAEDWRKVMRQTSLFHDYHLSGGQKIKNGHYYFGLGYLNDGGFVQNTSFERFSARFKGAYRPFRWLEAGLQVAGDKNIQKLPVRGDETFYYANIMPPVYPVFYRNAEGEKIKGMNGHEVYDLGKGNIPGESMGTHKLLPGYNLIQDLNASSHWFDTKSFWAMPYLSLKFLKHFWVDAHLNYRVSDVNERVENNSAVFLPSSAGLSTQMQDKHWHSAVGWSRSIGQHHLSVVAGYENLSRKSDSWQETDNVITAKDLNSMSLVSYFARMSENFKGKYSVYGVYRKDRTDLFPPNNRDIDSWVFGANWHVQKESFLQDVTFLSNWTISANYGQSKHRELSFSLTGYPEKSTNLDIGTEFGFIEQRLNFSVHYFIRNDENLGHYLPGSIGLPPLYFGGISLNTKGVEFELNTMPVSKQKFSWDIVLNLNHYKGVIQSMGEVGQKLYQNQMIIEEGQEVNTFYLPLSVGVDPVNGDELYAYNTGNGVMMTTNDYNLAKSNGSRYLGVAAPDWFGGLSNSIRYRNFELCLQITFGLGGKVYDGGYATLMNPQIGQNYSTDMINAWTPEQPDMDIPRLDIGNLNIAQPSSRFISSASYLNVHQLRLFYDFSNAITERLKLQEFRVSISANNLALYSARKGLNPQSTFTGMTNFYYPAARTIMFGIHAGL